MQQSSLTVTQNEQPTSQVTSSTKTQKVIKLEPTTDNYYYPLHLGPNSPFHFLIPPSPPLLAHSSPLKSNHTHEEEEELILEPKDVIQLSVSQLNNIEVEKDLTLLNSQRSELKTAPQAEPLSVERVDNVRESYYSVPTVSTDNSTLCFSGKVVDLTLEAVGAPEVNRLPYLEPYTLSRTNTNPQTETSPSAPSTNLPAGISHSDVSYQNIPSTQLKPGPSQPFTPFINRTSATIQPITSQLTTLFSNVPSTVVPTGPSKPNSSFPNGPLPGIQPGPSQLLNYFSHAPSSTVRPGSFNSNGTFSNLPQTVIGPGPSNPITSYHNPSSTITQPVYSNSTRPFSNTLSSSSTTTITTNPGPPKLTIPPSNPPPTVAQPVPSKPEPSKPTFSTVPKPKIYSFVLSNSVPPKRSSQDSLASHRALSSPQHVCPHCQLSFKFLSDLTSHWSANHGKKKRKTS